MFMFGERRRLQRLAAPMLLVWLFALTSGIVNACLVGPDVRPAAVMAPSDAAADQRAQALTTPHVHQHGAEAPGHGHPSTPAEKSPCAKFCADEQSTTPLAKLQTHPLSGAWLALLPTRSLAVQAALEPSEVFDSDPGGTKARVPIPIAFLRLTL